MITPLQLNDIPWLVAVLFLLLSLVLYSMHPGGLIALQAQRLRNTQSERTFNSGGAPERWGIAVMTLAYMFTFGFLLFYATHGEVPALLSDPSPTTWMEIGLCILLPLGWFLFQWFLFNWVCYLFGETGSAVIFNRVYLSVHVLAMPLALLLLLALFLVPVPSGIILILLTALFILTQIVCIFNGFRIFMRDYASALLIFVYLCTLEIAPLVILFTKLRGVA